MTPEQIETNRRWVEALRSGKYSQTCGALRDAEGYCCLGVLSELVGVPSQPMEARTLDEEHLGEGTHKYMFPIKSGEYSSYEIPPGEWFSQVTGLSPDTMSELANENDNWRSFSELAARIEKEVKSLNEKESVTNA